MSDKDQQSSTAGLFMLGSGATGLGCLTPLIIVGAIFVGRWLDSLFGTEPWILLALILAAIPASLLAIIGSALNAARVEQQAFRQRRNGTGPASRNPLNDDWEDGH
jgi:hypothetical protein